MKVFVRMFIPAALFMLFSCKPSLYTGQLDNPYGNWRGVHTEYRFNGAEVSSADSCAYNVISFYRQGLCCIKGHKGALSYSYDPDESVMEIGTDVWRVNVLTGAEMILEFLDDKAPVGGPEIPEEGEQEDSEPESSLVPTEYRGVTIVQEGGKYVYTDKSGNKVRCYCESSNDSDGNLTIRFWYDTHTDRFEPYN